MYTDGTGQFPILALIATAGIILFSSVALRGSTPESGTPMSETEQTLALVGLTMWTAGLGNGAFLKAGLKGIAMKFASETIAYANGVPYSSWDNYLFSYYLSGTVGMFGKHGWQKYARIGLDVFGRPAADQAFSMIKNGDPWDWGKYTYNVGVRAFTYGMSDPYKIAWRGVGRIIYYELVKYFA